MKVKICLFVNPLEFYQVSKSGATRLSLYNPPTNLPAPGPFRFPIRTLMCALLSALNILHVKCSNSSDF